MTRIERSPRANGKPFSIKEQHIAVGAEGRRATDEPERLQSCAGILEQPLARKAFLKVMELDGDLADAPQDAVGSGSDEVKFRSFDIKLQQIDVFYSDSFHETWKRDGFHFHRGQAV